jgi:alpha-beta hydrolase superfamily lysophospholipase
MVLPAGDEQQRRPVVVLVVDEGVLVARLQGGQRTAPPQAHRCRDVVALVLTYVIGGLERPPILMGHSAGGVFTQLMLDRGSE